MTIEQHITTRTPVLLHTAKEQSDFFKFLELRYPDTRIPVHSVSQDGYYEIAIVLDASTVPTRIHWSWSELTYFTERDGKRRYQTPIPFNKYLYKR
jgi:hypothetical protein